MVVFTSSWEGEVGGWENIILEGVYSSLGIDESIWLVFKDLYKGGIDPSLGGSNVAQTRFVSSISGCCNCFDTEPIQLTSSKGS